MQIKNVLSGAKSVIIDATKSTGVKVSAAATVPTALILDHLGKLPQAAAEMFYRNGDGQTIHSLNGTCTVIEDNWFGHVEHPMWDPFNTCSWLYPDKPWLNVTSSIGQPIADALYGKLPDSIAAMQNGTAGMFYTTKGGIIHSVNGTCTVIQDTLFGRVSHPMFDPLNTCSTLYPDKPYLHVTDAIKQPVADAFFGLTPERAAQLQKEAAEKSGSHVADAFNQTAAQITNSTAEHAPATVKKTAMVVSGVPEQLLAHASTGSQHAASASSLTGDPIVDGIVTAVTIGAIGLGIYAFKKFVIDRPKKQQTAPAM